jgi:hypothetical protein
VNFLYFLGLGVKYLSFLGESGLFCTIEVTLRVLSLGFTPVTLACLLIFLTIESSVLLTLNGILSLILTSLYSIFSSSSTNFWIILFLKLFLPNMQTNIQIAMIPNKLMNPKFKIDTHIFLVISLKSAKEVKPAHILSAISFNKFQIPG